MSRPPRHRKPNRPRPARPKRPHRTKPRRPPPPAQPPRPTRTPRTNSCPGPRPRPPRPRPRLPPERDVPPLRPYRRHAARPNACRSPTLPSVSARPSMSTRAPPSKRPTAPMRRPAKAGARRSHVAVKANSNLAVLNVFARAGAGFDIVSAGELERALKAGASAGKIVFSGVGKTADEMRMALRVGVKCFNVESIPRTRQARRGGRRARPARTRSRCA